MKKVLAAVLVLSLSACANRPETIHASFVSHERFVGLECGGLAMKKADATTELTKLSKMQDGAASQDALSVFLLGIPVSKLFGNDQEGAIARTKGEVEAIETAQIKNGCEYERVAKVVEAPKLAQREDKRDGWWKGAK